MPIVTLQKKIRELGRIRIGVTTTGSNGRKRPEKLDRFRLTSSSRELLDRVSALYGGRVQAWSPQGGGPNQWEVVTTATRLPILVPPQPITQWFELWSGGGCARRCDGEREVLTEQPCLCDPDPTRRECKPTTRLNVVLRDVEGIGVWRLESHGYYAAVELPEAAELLARAGGYISGWLSLEARTAKRDGKTRNWMVPTLEIDITPAQLLEIGLPSDTTPTALERVPAPAALPAGRPPSEDALLASIAAATSVDGLREVHDGAARAGAQMTPALQQAFAQRAAQLRGHVETDGADADSLWSSVLEQAPQDWSTEDVEADFGRVTGVAPGSASVDDIRRYLAQQAS